MPTEVETLQAEIADLKRQKAESEALEPLRREAEALREWSKSVSKPPAPVPGVTKPAETTSYDYNDLTPEKLQDPKNLAAAAKAVHDGLKELGYVR